jgi:hypothetical protein
MEIGSFQTNPASSISRNRNLKAEDDRQATLTHDHQKKRVE